ncbi:MAG: DUF2971 domain-containing protein [Kiritimatiellae bacterium]|nr:DUF2971 domain-containing protein [Kiritimatiellia bacterium]
MKLYKYMCAQYALEYLHTGKLKVSTLFDVNDPNEWIPYFSSTDGSDYLADKEKLLAFKNQWGSKYGFVSLSAQMDSSIMWGHYGDKFKGVVLEFSVKDTNNLFPVRYQSTRYFWDQHERDRPMTQEQMMEFLAQKSNEWSYEAEWRFLVQLSDCEVCRIVDNRPIYLCEPEGQKPPALVLSGVVLGPDCPLTFGHVLTAAGSSRQGCMTVKRMGFDSRTYALTVCDIYPSSNGNVLHTNVRLHVTREVESLSGNE